MEPSNKKFKSFKNKGKLRLKDNVVTDADSTNTSPDPSNSSGMTNDYGRTDGATGTTAGNLGECYTLCDNDDFKILTDAEGRTVLAVYKGCQTQEAAAARQDLLSGYLDEGPWNPVEEERLPDGYAICYLREDVVDPDGPDDVEDDSHGYDETKGLEGESPLEGEHGTRYVPHKPIPGGPERIPDFYTVSTRESLAVDFVTRLLGE